jgi:hypothetical protein
MRLSVVCCVLLVSGCATTGSQEDDLDLSGAWAVHKSPPMVKVTGELGTATNPVRVLMPEGEREYLHRLRCANGSAPTFERQGSAGIGPYGKILDIYSVQCGTKSSSIYMDMYHCSEEERPVPGFDIVPELGRRAKQECR